jgi:hypothetical protein
MILDYFLLSGKTSSIKDRGPRMLKKIIVSENTPPRSKNKICSHGREEV